MVEMFDVENFEKRISENIIGLDLTQDQLTFFAWLCAVRALPFMGASGNFDFWKKYDKFKHLYSVINAIDTAADTHTAVYPYAVYDTASKVVRDTVYTISGTTHAAAYAARAAVYAVRVAAYAAPDATYSARRAAAYAARAATYVTRAAAYIDAKYSINLDKIICEDLSYIKSNIYDKFNSNTDLYGETWGNFQKALKDVGCGYWGKLYENIFKNRFQIDKEALERRLSVPQEIKMRGAKIVADYLEQMELTGSENLNEARIIILGEKGAGKTCLARRLRNPSAPMAKPNESTEGVDTTTWRIKGEDASSTVNAHIWDFAGHVITHAAHRCFLSERCLYILVYDGRTERRNRIEYWLDHVRTYGGDAPVLILVNKFDKNRPDIPENTLKRKYSFIVDFVHFSIDKDIEILENFRVKISKLIHDNPIWNSQKMPSNYYKVKNVLGKFFDDKIDYITKEQFYGKANENNVTDKEKQNHLLEALHSLGICLWYKEIEGFDMLVLNPDWITNGIYKVINWVHNNSKHTIYFDDFERIFNDDEKKRYPKDQFNFILELMKKYELAYSKEDSVITIPHLLKEDQPAKLPDFPIEESLMIKYVSEQSLPPNTVCRLIVRRHEEIRSDGEVWRYGVVLKYEKNTIALVYEDDRNIVITVKGGNKGEYISKLRETMNEIFDSYKSQKPELQYRIVQIGENIPQQAIRQSEDDDILLPYETIKTYAEMGQQYLHPQLRLFINLGPTAQVFNITNNIINDNSIANNSNNTITNTFNFNNCNINLQGDINSLIRALDLKKDSDIIEELQGIVSDLEEAETVESPEKMKKSGLLAKLSHFIEDLGDENSRTYKAINGLKNGVKTAQKMAKTYNDIAQWIGLPQVPKPFLG
ncbi:MAG: hypothetical protein LBU83_02535 [Bacteroidales bacterium]|jgi:small GTP-binding protein|nr:hypothetical protein [Bacteroidales bacterium]